jgi:diaminohydroxyphosphoribosylaminopyrimidine deaminase/5-amino-6-(5-phosphoribosylamino)uracil reductase
LLYLAPKLLGPGRDFALLPALPSLDKAPTLRFESVTPVGEDLCLRARFVGADRFVD